MAAERRALAELLQRAQRASTSGLRASAPTCRRSCAGLDCFVLPSQAEGVSNTILEAMATGFPVIATNVGGNPELIEPWHDRKLVCRG